MYKNLFNEIVFEPEDFVPEILKSSEFAQRYRLILTPNTKMGFALHSNFMPKKTVCNTKGVYAIWHKDTCFYVGSTNVSVQTRVGRFIKEVRGKSTRFEDHAAGRKFRKWFGEKELDNVQVSSYALTVPDYIRLDHVEREVIKILKPIGNEK